ncbi:conserved hypothetical protein [Actinacidiphila bryophytorum]|uniref:Uncharacterized protein n=2 Tax=Actinacidiphila bryophytorum TaxID=1436133 RepID=A0A9W4H1Q8_9ACTN|nr:conserved hypothetical protein [Actinacidiphila bryophytorum]
MVCHHAAMPIPAPNGDYALTAMYSVADDAWYLELDLVVDHQTVVVAVVPDEDPAREPTVCFNPAGRQVDIPYEVMRWFMGQVAEEIRTSRAWMRLRPDLVEVIHGLRQEHWGAVDDDEFPSVLAGVRTAVAETDLPAVLAAAFGRNLDGTPADDVQALLAAHDHEAGRI